MAHEDSLSYARSMIDLDEVANSLRIYQRTRASAPPPPPPPAPPRARSRPHAVFFRLVRGKLHDAARFFGSAVLGSGLGGLQATGGNSGVCARADAVHALGVEVQVCEAQERV